MSGPNDVVDAMCRDYSSAVNASDSETYTKLFAEDAIRVPPGAMPEYGRDAIQRGEQADYDEAKWDVVFARRDALEIADGWVYGLADVEVTMTAHSDGAQSNFRLNVGWLLERQSDNTWLIKRQLWNRKPEA